MSSVGIYPGSIQLLVHKGEPSDVNLTMGGVIGCG